MAKIEIRVDKEKLRDSVTVDEFIGLQEGDIKAIADVLSRFVWQDGAFLPQDQGRVLVGKMTMAQLMESAQAFAGKAEDVAVPPANGAGSE